MGGGGSTGGTASAGNPGGAGEFTIGAFARASRLSAKALCIYDELGLLSPARADESSGYRLRAERGRRGARAAMNGLTAGRAGTRRVASPDPGGTAADTAAVDEALHKVDQLLKDAS